MPCQMKRLLALALSALVTAAAGSSAVAAGVPVSEGAEFFEKNIRPLLVEHCYQCHSVGAEKGGKGKLLLDSRDATLKGGEGGPILGAGSPDGSRLIKALRWKDDKLQMPPKKALAPEQVALFEQWVKMGAPDPREGAPAGAAGAAAAGPVPGAI